MEFVPAVRKAFDNYIVFDGRASRSEYWWFVLFNVLVSAVASLLGSIGHDHGGGLSRCPRARKI